MRIDLNSDVGESFGPWRLGETREVMPYITSANVACGFHAGDPRIMRETVFLARDAKVGIGAHVGYGDLVGFGRRRLALSAEEIAADVLYQIGAIYAFTRHAGVPLRHVKAHGALYNTAERDRDTARGIVEGVRRFGMPLVLVASATSVMAELAAEAGIPVAREGFADRAYRADRTLVPRSEPGSVISDPAAVARRAVSLIRDGRIASADGAEVEVSADTVCIHGDTPGAAMIARAVRDALKDAEISVQAFDAPAGPPA